MSYESAMEKRILKTFKSKDNLIRKQQAERDELERRNDIMVTALSEIKATNDGESSQPISDIIQWCIGEIAKHKGE